MSMTLWTNAKYRSTKKVADTILANRSRYEGFTIPWYIVGALHFREASFNFNTHLHNGDPLTSKTVHVPAGRPPGRPPYTWERSAKDALRDFRKRDTVWDYLDECEKYNGLGYRNQGVPSPYIWSWSDVYKSGLYVADGKFDPNKVDPRPGVAAILYQLFKIEKPIGPIYYRANGEWVKELQQFLGVTTDGIAGPVTSEALYKYTHSYLVGDPRGRNY